MVISAHLVTFANFTEIYGRNQRIETNSIILVSQNDKIVIFFVSVVYLDKCIARYNVSIENRKCTQCLPAGNICITRA